MQQEQKHGRRTRVDEVKYKPRCAGRKPQLPRGHGVVHEHARRIEQHAVDDEHREKAVEQQRHEPYLPPGKQHAAEKAHEPEAEHLPRRPRPLTEEKVRDQARRRAGDKARLRREGHGREDHDRAHGLALRQPVKRRAPGHGQRRHRCKQHELARLRSAAFKPQHERHEHQPHEQQRREVVLPLVPHAHEHRHRRRDRHEQDAERGPGAPRQSVRHCTTSPHSTAPGAASRAMRAAAVV